MMYRRFPILVGLLFGFIGGAFPAHAQFPLGPSTGPGCTETGPYPFDPGSCLNATDLNAALELSPGGAPPTNVYGQGAGYGKFWPDTSVSPTHLRMCIVAPPGRCSPTYIAAQWYDIGAIDTTNGTIDLSVGGGILSVPSSGVVDLGLYPQTLLQITGTATINSFGPTLPAGKIKVLLFQGVATITYNANAIVIPGGNNVTTQAGGMALVTSQGNGVYSLLYQPQPTGGMSSISNNRVLGNVSGAPAMPSQLTPTQLTTLCNTFSSSASGCVPSPGGGSLGFVGSDAAFHPLPLTAASNSALRSMSTTGLVVGQPVYRAGFYGPGDGGAAYYTYSTSACLNGGAGDNGLQVQASGAGCWNADFLGSSANVRVWGAKGDCTTDDGPAFQKAFNTGLPIHASNGNYYINTGISLTRPIHFHGAGYTLNGLGAIQSPCPTDAGTYIVTKTSTVTPFTFQDVQVASGSQMSDFAFTQLQPTPGAGWTPTAYAPAILLVDTSSANPDYLFHNIGLGGIYQFINLQNNSARVTLRDIRGQTFYNLWHSDGAYDVSAASDIYDTPNYWSNDNNVISWQIANKDWFVFGRQDSFFGGNSIFNLGSRSCVRLTSTAKGSPTGILFNDLSCDISKYSVWVDSSEGTNGVTHARFDKIWAGGEQLSGTPITGGNVVQIDGLSAVLSFGDIVATVEQQSVINETNTTDGSELRIGSISGNQGACEWNYSGTTAGAGTFPTLNIAPATNPGIIQLLGYTQPDNCGAIQNTSTLQSSGLINQSSNALLYANGAGENWEISTAANGTTVAWPNFAETLILDNTTTDATLTVTLPSVAIDGRTIRLQCTNSITALTVQPSGSIVGIPSSCPTGKSYTFKFIAPTGTWYAGN